MVLPPLHCRREQDSLGPLWETQCPQSNGYLVPGRTRRGAQRTPPSGQQGHRDLRERTSEETWQAWSQRREEAAWTPLPWQCLTHRRTPQDTRITPRLSNALGGHATPAGAARSKNQWLAGRGQAQHCNRCQRDGLRPSTPASSGAQLDNVGRTGGAPQQPSSQEGACSEHLSSLDFDLHLQQNLKDL